MKKTYSYLRPYLQRMEQPVRKRRNQKFSVSELDLTRLHGEKISFRKPPVNSTLIKDTGTARLPAVTVISLKAKK